MYAVIFTGGKQYRVAKGDIIEVEKLDAPKAKEVIFKDVMLCADKKEVTVGKPYIKGAKVTAEFLGPIRGEKIVTHKYKRRETYHKTIGHRQDLVQLRIKSIEQKEA